MFTKVTHQPRLHGGEVIVKVATAESISHVSTMVEEMTNGALQHMASVLMRSLRLVALNLLDHPDLTIYLSYPARKKVQ